MPNNVKELDSLKGADDLMDKVIKTCHDINDDNEMWRLLDEDHARRNIGAEREAIIEKAQKEGLEKGMAEGIEKGIAQGERNKSIEIAKKLKLLGIPIEVIEECTGLSKEEIEQL